MKSPSITDQYSDKSDNELRQIIDDLETDIKKCERGDVPKGTTDHEAKATAHFCKQKRNHVRAVLEWRGSEDSSMPWPDTDNFEQMGDDELLEHAAEVTRELERCKRGVVPEGTDLDPVRAAHLCELRLGHIQDVFRARGRN